MSKYKDWVLGQKWTELQQVQSIPVFRELLEVLEEAAKPNATANELLVKGMCAQDAAFTLARVASTQAGMQSAVDTIRKLARPIELPKPQETPEPYSWVPKNMEEYQEYLQNRES